MNGTYKFVDYTKKKNIGHGLMDCELITSTIPTGDTFQ